MSVRRTRGVLLNEIPFSSTFEIFFRNVYFNLIGNFVSIKCHRFWLNLTKNLWRRKNIFIRNCRLRFVSVRKIDLIVFKQKMEFKLFKRILSKYLTVSRTNLSISYIVIQCPPLNRINFGQHKSDGSNRMIQLTDVFCVLLRYKWACNF